MVVMTLLLQYDDVHVTNQIEPYLESQHPAFPIHDLSL